MEEFDSFINNNEDVVVDFWAPWCGPCRSMLPLVESVQADTNKVSFAKVNIDENQDITERFKITSIPYFMKFKNGKQDNVYIGMTSKAKFQEFCGIE